jgi:hypothetical protein
MRTTSTSDVECDEAILVAALHARTHPLLAYVTGLGNVSIDKSRLLIRTLTSFQRCLGTFSTSITGSMNVVLPSETSGIQIAQSKWDHLNVFVCLKAPSMFGQKMHV